MTRAQEAYRATRFADAIAKRNVRDLAAQAIEDAVKYFTRSPQDAQRLRAAFSLVHSAGSIAGNARALELAEQEGAK